MATGFFIAGCSASPIRAVVAPAAPASDSSVSRPSDGVCRFTGPLTLAAPAADGSIEVPPTHPLVSYLGRVDCQAPGGPLLGFVGASVRVRFVGTGLELKLDDFGRGTAQSTNYYDVSVDGGRPALLEVSPQQKQYVLAAGLPEGEHLVELFKRGESGPGGNVGAGLGKVLGFKLHGRQLLPVSLPSRRLEFVGDSITCGYGNEVSTNDPGSAPFTTRASNGHKAYGALTAARLGASYVAVAYSGRGVSRNYAGSPGQVLPELYLQSVPEAPSATRWDPAQYTPDAVIINLGSNDFSTPGVDRRAFAESYARFLTTLRGYYPQAALVVVIGPMLSDAYPPGENALSSVTAELNEVLAARARAGDSRVHLVTLSTQSGPWGEDWHPSLATHERMADELTPRLKTILGW
ncbi:MAG TPA: SGNH/GDSL hydrolase family protein [Polyangiaceae bacterium]|nr:SGNH/GDSL hydrolase family protein [Polyangiaceae bacterium]